MMKRICQAWKPYKFYMMFHGPWMRQNEPSNRDRKEDGKHVILMRLECFKDVIELCNSITFAKTIGLNYKKNVCSSSRNSTASNKFPGTTRKEMQQL
jgi:hypothetical protein